jgi:predicted transcriptional regulator YdeE
MKKIIVELPEIKLVGITTRTDNAGEMNPETAKIGTTMHRFFGGNMQDKIINRKNPGRVYAAYTSYESDEGGKYTYFLGEEVTIFDGTSKEFEMLTIQPQTYVKFTSEAGAMPAVVIDMWHKIWAMDAGDLGGKRAYIADFEIYDERSMDPKNTIVDIYIGIKQ